MLTLVISHNITLTKEQRYSLCNKQEIEVVGVSIPVWFERGNTSEPAQEVFAKYKLTNQADDYQIKSVVNGYEINLPQNNPEIEKQLQEVDPEVLAALGIQREIPKPESLLDIQDGGSEGMHFRQFSKSSLIIDGQKTSVPLSIIHSVEIKTIEHLMETL